MYTVYNTYVQPYNCSNKSACTPSLDENAVARSIFSWIETTFSQPLKKSQNEKKALAVPELSSRFHDCFLSISSSLVNLTLHTENQLLKIDHFVILGWESLKLFL